jgi:hypothetical protein
MFVSNVQRNWIKTNTNALDGCFGVKERRGLPRRHEGPKFISALFVSRKDTKAQKKGGVPRRHEGTKTLIFYLHSFSIKNSESAKFCEIILLKINNSFAVLGPCMNLILCALLP